MDTSEGNALIPLVVGVVGHADIMAEDREKLENQVADLFREHRKRHPQTPVVLLTRLGEGADRIAARAAVREGVAIVPVLPMAQNDYQRQFTDPESVRELNDLLAGRACIEPLRADASAADRDEQAGLYIAVHCNVLIALWDGRENAGANGAADDDRTAAIVRFRRDGLFKADRPLPAFCRGDTTVLDVPGLGTLVTFLARRRARTAGSGPAVDTGPVADAGRTADTGGVADTGRSGADGSPPQPVLPGPTVPVPPAPSAPLSDPERRGLYALARLNRDAAWLEARHATRIAKSAEYLLPEAKAVRHPELAELRRRFAVADVLAIEFRDRVHWMLLAVAALALLTFASFEVFAHVWETPFLLAGYTAILIGLWVLYWLAVQRGDWQGRYLDYRALAEALRVQFFWRLAGIPLNAADFYLRRHTGELSWIRHAARVCNIGRQMQASDLDVATVGEHWIVDQRKYFVRSAEREKRLFDRWNWMITLFYITGIVVAVEVLAAMLWGIAIDKGRLHIAIVAMGLAPALAASIGFVLERRALESHVHQYRLMAGLFGRAEEALSKAGNVAGRQDILGAIGREALAENGDWYFTHRLREIAPPRGG